MKVSANEVMTLAAKAARGAGAPPEQATAFGRATLCHLIADRGEDELRTALAALPVGPIADLPVAFTQALEAAAQGRAAKAISASALLLSFAEAQPFATHLVETESGVRLLSDLGSPGGIPSVSRVEVSDDLYTELQRLAARILVPESETSRLSGAGAGLTDND